MQVISSTENNKRYTGNDFDKIPNFIIIHSVWLLIGTVRRDWDRIDSSTAQLSRCKDEVCAV